jgi:hypothetical protein
LQPGGIFHYSMTTPAGDGGGAGSFIAKSRRPSGSSALIFLNRGGRRDARAGDADISAGNPFDNSLHRAERADDLTFRKQSMNATEDEILSFRSTSAYLAQVSRI